MNTIRFESSHKLPMSMELLFATLLAGGGVGKVFAAIAPGVTVAPGTLVGAATEPTVISSSPGNRATNVPISTNTSDNVVTGAAVIATFAVALWASGPRWSAVRDTVVVATGVAGSN